MMEHQVEVCLRSIDLKFNQFNNWLMLKKNLLTWEKKSKAEERKRKTNN